MLAVIRRCAGVDKPVAPSSPHVPAGCLVSDGCWSRGTVVGIQQSKANGCLQLGQKAGCPASAARARAWEHRGPFVCLHVWMSSLRSVGQTERRTQQSRHLHTSAVFICKPAAANTSVFMGASSSNRHRCWDAPETYLILCVFIFTSDK